MSFEGFVDSTHPPVAPIVACNSLRILRDQWVDGGCARKALRQCGTPNTVYEDGRQGHRGRDHAPPWTPSPSHGYLQRPWPPRRPQKTAFTSRLFGVTVAPCIDARAWPHTDAMAPGPTVLVGVTGSRWRAV